jgi:thioredoxin 1
VAEIECPLTGIGTLLRCATVPPSFSALYRGELFVQELPSYSEVAPERADLDASKGPVVVEFGSNGCGICQGTLPIITESMRTITAPHFRVEDGKGKRLGRSYGVKLWPTLIMLRDGKEMARVVRPTATAEIEAALRTIE